jgi:hypothetical protein
LDVLRWWWVVGVEIRWWWLEVMMWCCGGEVLRGSCDVVGYGVVGVWLMLCVIGFL